MNKYGYLCCDKSDKGEVTYLTSFPKLENKLGLIQARILCYVFFHYSKMDDSKIDKNGEKWWFCTSRYISNTILPCIEHSTVHRNINTLVLNGYLKTKEGTRGRASLFTMTKKGINLLQKLTIRFQETDAKGSPKKTKNELVAKCNKVVAKCNTNNSIDNIEDLETTNVVSKPSFVVCLQNDKRTFFDDIEKSEIPKVGEISFSEFQERWNAIAKEYDYSTFRRKADEKLMSAFKWASKELRKILTDENKPWDVFFKNVEALMRSYQITDYYKYLNVDYSLQKRNLGRIIDSNGIGWYPKDQRNIDLVRAKKLMDSMTLQVKLYRSEFEKERKELQELQRQKRDNPEIKNKKQRQAKIESIENIRVKLESLTNRINEVSEALKEKGE